MSLKTTLNYAPNFDFKKRKKKTDKIFNISLYRNEKRK